MELAATRVWGTHHINLTPMYFNKAEGCYRSTPACQRVVINAALACCLKKHLYYKGTTQVWFLYLHTGNVLSLACSCMLAPGGGASLNKADETWSRSRFWP